LGHVGKLEAQYANPQISQTPGHVIHELTVHWSAGAMGQNQCGGRISRDADGRIPQPTVLRCTLGDLICTFTAFQRFTHRVTSLFVI
jgi:hypothetical protein